MPEQAEIPIHFSEEGLLKFQFSNNNLHGKEKKSYRRFDYSELTEKTTAKDKMLCPDLKGVVRISLYCLKKVLIP